MNRRSEWEFLWLKYSRIGYVEKLSLFGFTLYRRSGSILEILGTHWVIK